MASRRWRASMRPVSARARRLAVRLTLAPSYAAHYFAAQTAPPQHHAVTTRALYFQRRRHIAAIGAERRRAHRQLGGSALPFSPTTGTTSWTSAAKSRLTRSATEQLIRGPPRARRQVLRGPLTGESQYDSEPRARRVMKNMEKNVGFIRKMDSLFPSSQGQRQDHRGLLRRAQPRDPGARGAGRRGLRQHRRPQGRVQHVVSAPGRARRHCNLPGDFRSEWQASMLASASPRRPCLFPDLPGRVPRTRTGKTASGSPCKRVPFRDSGKGESARVATPPRTT